MKLHQICLPACGALLSAYAGISQGATITSNWNGAYEGWSSAISWSPAGVPDSLANPTNIYNVLLDNGMGPTLDTAAEIQSLSIGATTGTASALADTSGKTLMVDQDLTNNGTLAVSAGSGLIVKGNLTNTANLQTDFVNPSTTASTISVAGTLRNSGTLYLDARGISADNLTVGTLVATGGTSGNIVIGKLSTLNINSELDVNSGSLLVQGKVNGLGLLNQFTGGSLTLVNQNLSITPAFHAGTLQIGAASLELDGSSLTVNGNVTNAGGVQSTGIHSNLSSGASSFNVTGTLTNTGNLVLARSGDAANIGTLVNIGIVGISTGTTLNLTNQAGGVTDLAGGSRLSIGGTFMAGGASGLANLQSIEGQLDLSNGQTLTSTPGSGTFTLGPRTVHSASVIDGMVTVSGATNWTIAGNVDNKGFLQATGKSFTTTGSFNNETGAMFEAGGASSVGVLTNAGTVKVDAGGTLTAANGFNSIAKNTELDLFGAFNGGGQNGLAKLATVDGALVLANGQTLSSTPGAGTLAVNGALYVGTGTNWTVNGDVVNDGIGFAQYTQSSGITNRGTLTVTGDLNNRALLEIDGTINAKTFQNSSLFENASNNPGAVHVTGTFTQTAGLTFLPNVQDFTAAGIDIKNGQFQTAGFSTNTLTIGAGGTVSTGQASVGEPLPSGTNFSGNPQLAIVAGGTVIDDGNFYSGAVNNAGNVAIGATGSLYVSTSYEQTAGTTRIDGKLVSPAVDIEAGVLEGKGAIDGNLSLAGASIFLEEISSANSFGTLDVTGTASLGGALDISLLNGFLPTNGEQFVILDATGGLNGIFASLNGNGSQWLVSYTANEVILTAQVAPVPEAPTEALAGAALMVLGLISRRTRRQKNNKGAKAL